MSIKTLKLLYYLAIFVSLILFGLLVVIAIFENQIHEIIATVGFTVLGYISIIMFAYAFLGLRKLNK